MQTRIRYITRKRKGIITESEAVVNKQKITIGRATDQDIFLSDLGVSYKHARLTILPDHSINISSVSQTGFYLSGDFIQNGIIKDRSEVIIGAYNLTIEINKDKFTVDITIEKIAEDIIQIQSKRMLPMQLDQTRLSKRRVAWLSMAFILVFFLAIPIAGFFNSDIDTFSELFMLPDDDVWLSGHLSSSHQHFADECTTCHTDAFQMVKDDACTQCHKNVSVHADPDIFDLPELQSKSCTTCHKEHSGNDQLIAKSELMCSECHGSLSETVETDLIDTSDFSKNHAEFHATLITNPKLSNKNPQAWERVDLQDKNIKHLTNLIFPHDVHLDDDGINGPLGYKALSCNDCHQTDSSGNYMLPVVMENHCQSCHRLEFDADDIERQLPHSDLKNMRKMLGEYYSFIALKGGYDEAESPSLIQKRRRPGKTLTKEEQVVALKWAQEKAQDVAEEVVEFRSCNLCHEVKADPQSELGWIIPEVNISQNRWLPKGKFEHQTHIITPCKDCHTAQQSNKSEDVLLPKIDTCRECHGNQQSHDKLQSTCISCHDFHQHGKMLMKLRNVDDAE